MTKQKEFKLYPGPKRVLELLNQGFEGRAGLLAEALRKDKTDTSRNLKKLMVAGMVGYTHDKSNSLIRNYSITEEGKKLLLKVKNETSTLDAGSNR